MKTFMAVLLLAVTTFAQPTMTVSSTLPSGTVGAYLNSSLTPNGNAYNSYSPTSDLQVSGGTMRLNFDDKILNMLVGVEVECTTTAILSVYNANAVKVDEIDFSDNFEAFITLGTNLPDFSYVDVRLSGEIEAWEMATVVIPEEGFCELDISYSFDFEFDFWSGVIALEPWNFVLPV